MTTLRQHLDAASEVINTYRFPGSLTEFRAAINPVLHEAGLGSLAEDQITSIVESKDTVYITTEYSVRGCSDSNDYELPSFIVDAENPMRAAKIWGNTRQIEETERRMKDAQSTVDRCKARIKELNDELALTSGIPALVEAAQRG